MIRLWTAIWTLFVCVGVVTAEDKGSFLRRSQLQGVAKPRLLAELPPAMAGIVAQVHVVENQQVSKDQPLVTLDNRVAIAAQKVAAIAAQRQAALRAAKLRWQLAERQLGRLEEAFERGASSPFEVEERRVARDQALAAFEQAKEDRLADQAALELATAELRRFTIHAPFDGCVVNLNAKIGTAVEPTTPIVSVANFAELEVLLFLPVEQYGTIQPGAAVTMDAQVPVGRRITGQVASVSPLMNAASGTFRCIVTIDNHERKLPGGFSVSLQTNGSSVARN